MAAEQKRPPNVAAANIESVTAVVSAKPCMMGEKKAKNGTRVSVCLDPPQAAGDQGCCAGNGGCFDLGPNPTGRLGNRLSEVLYSLQVIKATASYRGVTISTSFLPWNLFQLPHEICLAGNRLDNPDFVWKQVPGCPKLRFHKRHYDVRCEGVPSSEYFALASQHVVPYLSDGLKDCLKKKRVIDEDRLLTIHMRGEDIFGKPQVHFNGNVVFNRSALLFRIIEQPPCALYEKVISEGSFNRVLFISSKDLASPCFVWLKDYQNRARNRFGQDVKMEIQTGSLLEDVCAVLKAKHFVVSGSSLSHNLMSVSQEVKTIYVEGRGLGLDSFHTPLTCPLRNETNPFDLMTYIVPREKHNLKTWGIRYVPVLPGEAPATTEAAALKWTMKLKVKDVDGPYNCKGEKATPF